MTTFLQNAILIMMSSSPLALRVYAFPDGYGLTQNLMTSKLLYFAHMQNKLYHDWFLHIRKNSKWFWTILRLYMHLNFELLFSHAQQDNAILLTISIFSKQHNWILMFLKILSCVVQPLGHFQFNTFTRTHYITHSTLTLPHMLKVRSRAWIIG